MKFSDKEILSRVMYGDETAFECLRTHFSPSAFTFCSVLLKDESEAKNIISSVFDEIWKERGRINTDQDFQSFLYYNLRNKVFERLKQYQNTSLKVAYLERMHAFKECEKFTVSNKER